MHDLLIYLVAMTLVVPLSKYAGLGAVIGYLAAGAVIGPQGLSLLSPAAKGASQLGEFGVTLMLLLIGLELNPSLLWKLRGPIFGLGTAQVVGTVFILSLALILFGVNVPLAVAVAMICCVSSTAVALQALQEQGYSKSVGGERAFAVLLFQDMAVIPILAVLTFLGAKSPGDGLGSDTSPWLKASLIVCAVLAVVLVSRLLISPLFTLIARVKLRETFTALALLIVAASAALMHHVGLSPALGAFLAGVVLANSKFRHQIEADIEPFKGLLLGLFFITIGSNIQFNLIFAQPVWVAQWVAVLVVGKALLLYWIGRTAKMRPPESLLFAASLAQGGEFAFVMITQTAGFLPADLSQVLTASVAISMAIAPLLIKLTIQKGMSRFDCVKTQERLPDTVDESEKDNPVLLVGIGRFGQTLVRFLRANGYSATVLDIDSEQIDLIARFGIKSYFGDGTNLDLLRAAGLDRAKVLVLALDEPESTLRIASDVRREYPSLPIFTRAYDRIHAYKLLHLGVQEVMIETSGSALTLGSQVLKSLGMRSDEVEAKAAFFQSRNQHSIRVLSKRYHEDDRETFIQASKQISDQLEALFRSDPEELHEQKH